MEILIGLLIIGLVIALARMWSTATQESAEPTTAGTAPAYFSSNNAGTDWLYEQVQSSGDAGTTEAAVSDPSSASDSGQQDCSQKSDSSGDCPCPTDSSSYDTSGCSADSGSSGDSN